jgi:hypothetical protein
MPSDPPPLGEKIKAAIGAGTLPRIDHRVWAAKATGDRVCACCGAVIERETPEYEPQAGPGLYAHVACFTVWQTESARLDQVDGAAPSPIAVGA